MTMITIYQDDEYKTFHSHPRSEDEIIKKVRKLINFKLSDCKRLDYKDGFGFYKVSESNKKAYDYYVEIDYN